MATSAVTDGAPDANRDVTVVIITRNRPDELLRTLGQLTALPDRPRVLVVDNASSTDTAATVRATHPEVTVVTLDHNAGAHGRTIGARCLETPLIAFSDDDSWWAPHALVRAADLFDRHPRLGLAAARLLVGDDRRLDPTCEAMAANTLGTCSDLPGPTILGFIACAAIVRREAFLTVGGFSERYGVGGEEALLAIDLARAGWGLAYVEDLVAHHEPALSRDPAARRRRVIGNDLRTAWLRRPAPAAARRSLGVLRDGWANPATWLGVADALRGLPWTLRNRDPVPPWLEQQLTLLESRSAHRAA